MPPFFFSLDFPALYSSLKKFGSGAARLLRCPMDVTMREVPSIQFDNILNQLLEPQRDNRHCTRDSLPGEFPLAYIPTMVLHILTSYNLDPVDLARLEASTTLLLDLIMQIEHKLLN